MRIFLLTGFLLVSSGCAGQLRGVDCDLNDEELASLKGRVHEFLADELGETYAFYDTDDSVLDSIVDTGGSCGILILPSGSTDDGSTLLHGDGVVLFDRVQLRPLAVEFFDY